jgi:cobalt-zinc-cadmium efflux system membrane fusion protein
MRATTPWLILIALSVAILPAGCGRTEAPGDSHAEHRHEKGHERDEATEESQARSSDDHADGDDHAGGKIRLGAGQLERLGATIATVGAGTVDEGIELLGEIHPNGDQLAHITPRFAGLVVDVRKTVGDHVKTGEILAVIESSESLAPYELKSLIDGTIIDKHLTRGEAVDRDRVCFVVADLSSVWADLSVYQKDFDHIHPGQPVRIRADHGHLGAEGVIGYVTPAIDPRTRTATARAVLPNPAGAWRPGMFVTALVLQPGQAEIAIPAAAIQTIQGQATAFALTGDGVEARPLSLGRRGETTVEVLAGLAPGDRVVATNSFLLKAELGKSEAEHQH